jgi:hypothetical protein
MFLIHAARVMNVRVDFANVVEVTNSWLGDRINRIPFHITGEERAMIGIFRESPRHLERERNGPSFQSSLETR